MLHDLRYALRLIRKTPLASGVAILTVAIGVGANAAMVSVIHAVLQRTASLSAHRTLRSDQRELTALKTE